MPSMMAPITVPVRRPTPTDSDVPPMTAAAAAAYSSVVTYTIEIF